MKKPTPAQLAARARFAEMVRSGAFKKKAKKAAPKRKTAAKTTSATYSVVSRDGAIEAKGLTLAAARKFIADKAKRTKRFAGYWSAVKTNPRKRTVSEKISQLMHEGYPQKQAVAVALSEQRAGKVKATPRKRNPAPKFSVGDPVKFAPAVIKRVGGDARTKNMRGVIVEIMSGGKTALVDTHGTFVSEEGNSVRGIPTANLVLDLKTNPATGRKASRTKLNPIVPESRSRLPSNFKYGVQTKRTENWGLQAAFKTKAEAVDYAHAIAKNYPRLPIRVITFTGGPI